MVDEPAMPLASAFSPWARVYTKACLSLLLGLAAGYFFRGTQLIAPSSNAKQTVTPSLPMPARDLPATGQTKQVTGSPHGAMGAGHVPSLEELKQMADTQAAPLLQRLKTDPNDTALLIQLGTIYHSTHQFEQAVGYYKRAVQADPRNVGFRTKLASSLYRSGDSDEAIKQLNQALRYEPNDANCLFDLGVIKLNGKKDGKGALAAWQRLLKSNPQLSEERKATVQKLMAAVLTMLSDQNGMQGAPKP
jgi:cytochrome c-type biogenesis protein CcmH/NrfG